MTPINQQKLNHALSKIVNGDIKDYPPMANEDVQKQIDDARQKAVDARPGNVVASVSPAGTPSTHEDDRDPNGQAIAQLKDTSQVNRFEQDQKSAQAAAEQAAQDQADAAKAVAANVEAQASVDESEVAKQQLEAQEAREAASNAAARDRENATS